MILVLLQAEKEPWLDILLGYRVLIGNRVIVARNCDIVEEDVYCIKFTDYEQIEHSNEEIDSDNEYENTTCETTQCLNEY